MIRCCNHYGIDILSIQDLAIVLVCVRFSLLCLFCLFNIGTEHVGIDVCERREICELKGLAGNGPSLVAKTDGCKDGAVVR